MPRPTPAPAMSTPPAAIPTPSAPATASTLAELRARLEQVAERSPRDRALFEQIEVLDFTGDSARVAVVDGGSGQYLATNPDPIRTLLSRAAGRPLRLTLDTSRLRNAADAPRPTQVDDPSIRNDPLVRKAAELLDATVIAVTPRFIGDDAKVDDADGAGADRGDSAEAKTDDEAPPVDEPGVFGGVGFDASDESFE